MLRRRTGARPLGGKRDGSRTSPYDDHVAGHVGTDAGRHRTDRCGTDEGVGGETVALAATEPTAPAGFAVTPFAELGGAATAIAFGPHTGDPVTTRLYVTGWPNGRVVAY